MRDSSKIEGGMRDEEKNSYVSNVNYADDCNSDQIQTGSWDKHSNAVGWDGGIEPKLPGAVSWNSVAYEQIPGERQRGIPPRSLRSSEFFCLRLQIFSVLAGSLLAGYGLYRSKTKSRNPRSTVLNTCVRSLLLNCHQSAFVSVGM